MNVRSFKKYLDNMEVNETVYINAINLSENSIYLLREYIEKGTIKPLKKELEKVVLSEYMNDFLTGLRVFPQMTYIKRG